MTPRPAAVLVRLLAALGWMGGAIVSFVAMAVAARELSARMDTIEILFFRSLVGLLVMALLAGRLGPGLFATRRPGTQVARNVVHFAGQYLWVWGLTLAPLATVTAIEFTTPLWAALLAGAVLGERVTPTRWGATVAGVAGTLLIVRPGSGASGTAAAVLLASTVAYATSMLLVKALTRSDTPASIVFYMTLVQLPLGLVPSLFVWVTPAWADVPTLLALGITGLSAHYTMARAFALADLTVVLPLDFLRLPCVAVVGLVRYGEPLDGWTLVGAAVIFVANYVSLRAELRRARAAPVPGA